MKSQILQVLIGSSLSELEFTTDTFNNDLMTNSNGLHLIDIWKSFDLGIINGRFGDDKQIGDYTCYKKTVVAALWIMLLCLTTCLKML